MSTKNSNLGAVGTDDVLDLGNKNKGYMAFLVGHDVTEVLVDEIDPSSSHGTEEGEDCLYIDELIDDCVNPHPLFNKIKAASQKFKARKYLKELGIAEGWSMIRAGLNGVCPEDVGAFIEQDPLYQEDVEVAQARYGRK